VRGVLAAAVGSDWSSGGALLTFYFPIGLFIVIAAALYLGFSRPHRVPGHKSLEPAPATASASPAGGPAAHGQDASPATRHPQTGHSGPDGQQVTATGDDHEGPEAGE